METEFIEEMGQLLESLGPGRMVGRMMGYLLICNPDYQTAAQLAEALQASKGTISTVTRMMHDAGMIKKIRLPGDRAAYFKLEAETWPELIRRKAEMIIQIEQIATKGLEMMKDDPPERRARLQMMKDFYSFMSKEFPSMFERWLEHQEKNKK